MGTSTPVRSDKPVAVRCAGCRRTTGWTDGTAALRNSVYCSLWCMGEENVVPTEERLDQWKLLLSAGLSPVAIARKYDVAHSQVYVALGKMGPKTSQVRAKKSPPKPKP